MDLVTTYGWMLFLHNEIPWSLVLDKMDVGCCSYIHKMVVGLDTNERWLLFHHTEKRGCSYYTQWSLLCAPIMKFCMRNLHLIYTTSIEKNFEKSKKKFFTIFFFFFKFFFFKFFRHFFSPNIYY